MKISLKSALSILLLAGGLAAGAQVTWPKVVPFKNGGKITVYQPQPESLEGNKLTGRSAVSVNETAKSEPVFGAIFYDAYISTDKDSRTADLDSIVITNAKFTGVDDQAKIDKLTSFLQTEVPKWKMEISLDALVATIKRDHPNAEIYNNDPPKIIYATKPTSLIIIDGEPKVKKDKDLDADRVLNSPSLIFKEGSQWNMYNGGVWYKSNSITSGWSAETTMSKKVKSINEQIKKQEKEANDGQDVTTKPEVTDIVVSTVAAEIIQTKGTPVYKKIDSTNLSFISNSPDNIIKDNNTQTIYVLLAGRWFKSSSLNGPWTFNEPDKLPADFSNIPEGSEKDVVLASVAGTPAAEEAMIDSEIPQTAKVSRKDATVKVEYDGSPKFEAIEGTNLQRAENTNLTVLKESTGKYFALDNGVWFTGNSANGPWSVATVRPAEVDKIPSRNAAYNAKFVYIYEVTPEYTIQGYTAGYLGSYIQGDPVIVFGTGFHYAPWYGSMYYPAPVTWGFGFSYNPWTGWSMNFGFNIGFLHIGFGGGGYGYGGGWFGPPMYRPPYYRPPYGGGGYYRPPYGGGGYNNRPGYGGGGNNININTGGNNININSNNRNNLYNNKQGVSSKNNTRNNNISNRTRENTNNNLGSNNKNGGGNKTGANNNGFGGNNNNNSGLGNNNKGGNGNNNNGGFGNNKPNAIPSKNNNDVFADRDGNVFKQDNKGGVSERDNKTNSFKPVDNKKPSGSNNGSNFNNPSSNINRDAQSRDRGNNRTNNFNQTQARPATAKPSGGSGGGGAKPPAAGGVKRR